MGSTSPNMRRAVVPEVSVFMVTTLGPECVSLTPTTNDPAVIRHEASMSCCHARVSPRHLNVPPTGSRSHAGAEAFECEGMNP
jgi:hypothetical protein